MAPAAQPVKDLIDGLAEKFEAKLKALPKVLSKDEVLAAVQDELGTTLKGLQETIAAAVLQKVPATGGFSPAGASEYDPEKGLSSMSKSRREEIKKALCLMHLPASARTGDIAGDRMSVAKALSVGVGADGGFLVPEEFQSEVLRKLVKISLFRGWARNFNGVGLKGSIPRETGTVTIGYVAEGGQPSNTQFALGQIIWGLNKRMALTTLSKEIFKFSAVDVITLLATMYAEQNQKLDDQVFATGTGSNQPRGFTVDISGMNTAAQDGVSLDWNDLITLKHLLPVQYRGSSTDSVFMANNTNIQGIAKMKDDQNRPLFLELGMGGLAASTLPPQTVGFLLGHPLIENNNLANAQIWYMNAQRAYVIFDQGTMEVVTSDQVAFDTDQIRSKMTSYDDGKVAIAEAAAYLTAVAI